MTDRLGLVGSIDCLHGRVPRSVDGVDDGLVGIGRIQSFCCRLTSVGDQTTINRSRTCQSTHHTCQSHLSTWRSDYNQHITHLPINTSHLSITPVNLAIRLQSNNQHVTHLSINSSHLSITPVYLAIRLQSTCHAPANQLVTPVNHTCIPGH